MFALVSVAVTAADAVKEDRAAPAPTKVAQADARATSIGVRGTPEANAEFPPLEAGVRHAAAQGPTALRRYTSRTQAIYGYSYWDFAKLLPKE